MNLLLVIYTKPLSFREYNKAQEVVLHEVVKIVKTNDADFPFPTTTLDAGQIVDKLKCRVTD